MSKRLNQESILEYECEYKGKTLECVPCSFLVHLYNEVPTGINGISKELDIWLEDNIGDIEEAAAAGGTLNSYFEGYRK